MKSEGTITGRYIGHYGRQDFDDTLALHSEAPPPVPVPPLFTVDFAAIELRVLTNLLGWRRYFLRFVPARIQVAVLMGRTRAFNTIVAAILLFPWSLVIAAVLYLRRHK